MQPDSKRKIKRKEMTTMMMRRARKANQGLKEADLTRNLERPVDVHRTRRRVPVAETLSDRAHLRAESLSSVQMMMGLRSRCMMMVPLKMRTMIRASAICLVSLP